MPATYGLIHFSFLSFLTKATKHRTFYTVSSKHTWTKLFLLCLLSVILGNLKYFSCDTFNRVLSLPYVDERWIQPLLSHLIHEVFQAVLGLSSRYLGPSDWHWDKNFPSQLSSFLGEQGTSQLTSFPGFTAVTILPPVVFLLSKTRLYFWPIKQHILVQCLVIFIVFSPILSHFCFNFCF